MDEGDFDDEQNSGEEIQLGFISNDVNVLFQEEDWSAWDGGKCGGKPIWLDPVNLPTVESLQCRFCKEPMIFLLQIYCPLDEPLTAFHRCLYLFCCKSPSCLPESPSESRNIVCFRSQLPKHNPFYSSKDNIISTEERPIRTTVCELCGSRAPNRCSKCKQASYCSRSHQKMHWSKHKKECGNPGTRSLDFQVLFPELSICIEEEELEDEKDAEDEILKNATIWEGADAPDVSEGEIDEDVNLTQDDYSNCLGTDAIDDQYTRFLSRVRRGGQDQILRYHRWNDVVKPLASSSSQLLDREGQIPTCPTCGSPRKFEFQVMPQLLYFLSVDKSTELPIVNSTESPVELSQGFDFGTLDVYTCISSCTGEHAYAEEFVWTQPIIDKSKCKEELKL